MKIFARFEREAAPEIHNPRKVKDFLHVPGCTIEYMRRGT